MSAVVAALERVAADLVSLDARVALVGGLAVSARAEPRFTRDLDFAVAVTDEQDAERLISALQGLGYRVLMVLEHQTTGRLATVRLVPPLGTADETVADLLFASTGIEAEIVARADVLALLPGLDLPVASIGHLIAMKILCHDAVERPRDADDLLGLLAVAGEGDLEEARAALRLIDARGRGRGKDLATELSAFLARAARARAGAPP